MDGGEHTLRCSACSRDLAKIWVVRPNLPIKSFVRAECAYCGDHSFELEVIGQFLAGHVDGVAMADNIMEDCHESGGTIIQKVLIKTVRE